MSVPTAIFLDTCILDQHGYNFGASAILALLNAIQGREFSLLLPDPTEREINRHIRDSVKGAVKAMEEARRKAPFLKQWQEWPMKGEKSEGSLLWTLQNIAREEWETFLKNFRIERIGYDGVKLNEIMDWYDRSQAPFGSGKKRKEFPDALAIAAIVAFAKKAKMVAAVISADDDIKQACTFYPELLHYGTVPLYVEALLSSDARVAKIKEGLHADDKLIIAAIREEFSYLAFYPEADPSGDVEDVEVGSVEMQQLNIVGIGAGECSIAFQARVDYAAFVTYDDRETAIIESSEDFYMPLRRYKGTVVDWTEISGLIKANVNDTWTALEEITLLKLDDTDVCVTAEPEEFEYL